MSRRLGLLASAAPDAGARVAEHLRALEESLPRLPSDAQREALGGLARLEALLRLDLASTPPQGPSGAAGDRLLTAPEAAARLAVTPEYLYRHAHQLPFAVRLGRAVRFSAAGLDEFIRTRRGR